jgi:hypothetical protein
LLLPDQAPVSVVRRAKEDMMRKLGLLAACGAAVLGTAAMAHDTATGFSSRGACESASASMSNAEQGWLLESFPEFFDTPGEASSFLTKAWTCDLNASNGQFYITDHIEEILGSRWFDRRNH